MILMKTNGSYRVDQPALETLANARKAFGLTHAELAAKLGIGATHMKRIERGYGVPTLALLQRWAKAVGCEVEICVSNRFAAEKRLRESI